MTPVMLYFVAYCFIEIKHVNNVNFSHQIHKKVIYSYQNSNTQSSCEANTLVNQSVNQSINAGSTLM